MATASVSDVLSKLKKQFSDTFANVDIEGKVKRLPLDSPQLNYIFGGQFAKGRVYEIFGPESSGKSTLSTYIASQIQKHNDKPIVVYVDLERSFDSKHAVELGLDLSEDKFIFMQPLSGEDGIAACLKLIQQLPIGLIIWDSVASTPTKSELEDFSRATYGGTAKLMSVALKVLNPYLAKYDTSMILINQERAQIGGYSPVPGATTTTGGEARKFYSSWRGRVTRIEWLKDSKKAIGIKMKVRNVKSKIGIPCREAILKLYFNKGFDTEEEYNDFIIEFLVQRSGAWYNNEQWGLHVHGSDAVIEFLKNNPTIYEDAKKKIDEILCDSNKLDTSIDKTGPEITQDEIELLNKANTIDNSEDTINTDLYEEEDEEDNN